MSLSALSAYYGSDEESDAEGRSTQPGGPPSKLDSVHPKEIEHDSESDRVVSTDSRGGLLAQLDARLIQRMRIVQRATGEGNAGPTLRIPCTDDSLDEAEVEGWRALAKIDFRPIMQQDRTFRDPLSLNAMSEQLDQYGTNFAPEIFDPRSLPLSDFYVSIQRQMASASMNLPASDIMQPSVPETTAIQHLPQAPNVVIEPRVEGGSRSNIPSDVAAAIAIATLRAGQQSDRAVQSSDSTRKKSRWDAGGDR